MTFVPPLASPFDSPSATSTTTSTSTSTTTSPSTTPPSTTTPTLPITNHYGGALPPPSTQTCTQACTIALPVILVSLLILGLLFAYYKHRHHTPLARRAPRPPLKSAIAAGSVAPTVHKTDRSVSLAQRVRGFFASKEGRERIGVVGEEGKFATLRQSVRRDPRARGYVDLEAGREREGSERYAGSEVTLAEALAEGGSEGVSGRKGEDGDGSMI
ncbi:hypothetical protein MMC26_003796 [Xylographa opegraphella]|nr:hypothetical protein [Xylographa opegraphella]